MEQKTKRFFSLAGKEVTVKLNNTDNPSCPECGHYNALLLEEFGFDNDSIAGDLQKCRDCGLKLVLVYCEAPETVTDPDGFVNPENKAYVDTLTSVGDVINERAPHLAATVAYLAGGIYAIQIRITDNLLMYWGVPDGTWGADITDNDGDSLNTVVTALPLDEPFLSVYTTILHEACAAFAEYGPKVEHAVPEPEEVRVLLLHKTKGYLTRRGLSAPLSFTPHPDVAYTFALSYVGRAIEASGEQAEDFEQVAYKDAKEFVAPAPALVSRANPVGTYFKMYGDIYIITRVDDFGFEYESVGGKPHFFSMSWGDVVAAVDARVYSVSVPASPLVMLRLLLQCAELNQDELETETSILLAQAHKLVNGSKNV